MSTKVMVYNFTPDAILVWPLPKRTKERIVAAGGIVFFDTAQELDEVELDAAGYFFPPE
jgi:hypothetical protein